MIRFPIFHRGGVGWGELGWGGAGVGFPKSTCSKGAEKENVSHQLRKRRIRNGRQYKKSDLPPQRPLCTPVDPTYPDIIGRCLHLHFTLYVVWIHFISQDNSQLLRFEHCLHMAVAQVNMDYFERLLPFLVSRQFAHGRTISADIHCVHDFVEIFSGMESVSQGARSFGFQGLSIDKKHGQSHDILTPLGFLTCLSAVMHIKRHGFLFLAPPCSTWVWMSHGSTGRRRNNAMGDPHNNYVKSQNRLVSRLCHIIWLACKRGVFVIIEQPQDSCMELHPRLAHLLKRFRMGTFKLDMGAYGAFSQKPTKLWGTAPWLHKMTKKLTGWERQVVRDNGVSSGVTRSWIDTNGKRRCEGGKNLKATQSYPVGFGQAHALFFSQFVEVGADNGEDCDSDHDIASEPDYDSDMDMFDDFFKDDCYCWSRHVKEDKVPDRVD